MINIKESTERSLYPTQARDPNVISVHNVLVLVTLVPPGGREEPSVPVRKAFQVPSMDAGTGNHSFHEHFSDLAI